MFDALTCLLDIICIKFDTKLNRQIIDVPMGTYCAPFIADMPLFSY